MYERMNSIIAIDFEMQSPVPRESFACPWWEVGELLAPHRHKHARG